MGIGSSMQFSDCWKALAFPLLPWQDAAQRTTIMHFMAAFRQFVLADKLSIGPQSPEDWTTK